MRKSVLWIIMAVFAFAMMLTGCGQPNSADVLTNLKTMRQDLSSYKSTAMMTVKLQNSLQKYYVETWYNGPHAYRIALGNENKEINQVILRNDTGLYIVSPRLKKSFRFQGEWAESQGHIYLFNSVIDRILAAADRQTTMNNEQHTVTFDLPMSVDHPLLAKQSVELSLGNLAPKMITLYDKSNQAVVTLDYKSFKRGVKFKSSDFSPKQITAGSNTDAEPVGASANENFGIIQPSFVPTGSSLHTTAQVDGQMLLRYVGKESFTLVEERPTSTTSFLDHAEWIDLLGVPAVVTGGGQVKTMYWLYGGVEFAMTGSMPLDQMAEVASSTLDQTGK